MRLGRERTTMIKLTIDENMAEVIDIVSDRTLGKAFRKFVENMTTDEPLAYRSADGTVDTLAKYFRKHSEIDEEDRYIR